VTGVPIGGAGGSSAVGRVAVHPQARTLLAGRGGRICGIGSRGGDLTAITGSRRTGAVGDDRLIAARLIGLRLAAGRSVAARVRVRGLDRWAVEAVTCDHLMPDHRSLPSSPAAVVIAASLINPVSGSALT
jgi:hypothetical protein